jgi:hypothetical protein
MAALSWPDCQKNFNRVQKLMNKIESFGTANEEKFTLIGSNRLIGLGINRRDSNTDNSWAWWQHVLRQGVRAPSPKTGSYPFIDASGKLYRFSDILKTQEFGSGGFNLGNTGEGIFAFISPGDVKKVIDGLKPYVAAGKGKAVTTTNVYDSPNANVTTMDKVHLVIELGEKDMKNLKKDYALYQGIIPAAALFCNGRKVRKWADELYNNNQSDKIEVISAGVSGATQTKIDTFVKVNGKRVNINISLKVGDVKQFGQVGGMLYKTDGEKYGQVEFFREFGIKIGNKEKEFEKFAAIRDYGNAFQVSFKEAVAAPINPTDIAKGLAYHATLREKNVEMVDLQIDRAVVYRFDRIVSKFADINMVRQLVIGKSNLPTIKFLADNGETIFQLRAAKGGTSGGRQYYRSYVEKGRALKQLIGTELKLDLIQ